MHKKGISPLISVVILTALTVAIVITVTVFGRNITKLQQAEVNETLEKFKIEKQLNLIVEKATSCEGNPDSCPIVGEVSYIANIKIVNRADITIEEWIIQRILKDGTTELIDSSYTFPLGPFETKELGFNHGITVCNTDYYRIIPKINGKASNYKLEVIPANSCP